MVPGLLKKDLRHNFLALLPDQIQFSEFGFKDKAHPTVDNRIRSKDEFLLNYENIREVSPNTSDSFCTIIFDVDLKWHDDVDNDASSEYKFDEEQLLYWNIEQGLIPEPTWVTVNPISQHYHVVYLLDRFYLKKYGSYVRKYQKIYNYLAPILGADKGYNGLSTHNPLYYGFEKPIVNNRTYALDELLDFVVDSELNIENEKIVQNTERRISDNRILTTGKDHRNNTIFMRLMYFAKHYPEQDLWELAKMWRDAYAAKFPNKPYITGSQLRATVLSVKKYQNDGKLFINQLVDLYDENIVVERKSDFTEKQAERGRKSGFIRKEQRQKKIVEMENLIRLGKDKTEIKDELGISERTYQTYLKQLKTRSMQ